MEWRTQRAWAQSRCGLAASTSCARLCRTRSARLERQSSASRPIATSQCPTTKAGGMFRSRRCRPSTPSTPLGATTRHPKRSKNATCRRTTMAANYPDVIPMIAYEDGPKAMDWLSSAFGFTEQARMLDKSGRLSHGEMQAGDGVIMLATPTPDYQAPRHHREAREAARKWSTGSSLL